MTLGPLWADPRTAPEGVVKESDIVALGIAKLQWQMCVHVLLLSLLTVVNLRFTDLMAASFCCDWLDIERFRTLNNDI